MNEIIRFHATVPKTALQKKLLAVMSDRRSKEEVHAELGAFVNKYVPMKSGELRRSFKATAKYATWTAPHAWYQYKGEVWGPNKAIYNSDGKIVGWENIPFSKKRPLGRKFRKTPVVWKGWRFGYTTPGTTDHWWEEALEKNGMRAYTNRVTNILKKRARRLNKQW